MSLEKNRIPIKAPKPNVNISRNCQFLSTESIYSYWFKKSNTKAPEIPGSIIAHSARAPDNAITGNECPICSVANPVNTKANKNPIANNRIFLTDKPPTLLQIKTADASINPEKKAYVGAARFCRKKYIM